MSTITIVAPASMNGSGQIAAQLGNTVQVFAQTDYLPGGIQWSSTTSGVTFTPPSNAYQLSQTVTLPTTISGTSVTIQAQDVVTTTIVATAVIQIVTKTIGLTFSSERVPPSGNPIVAQGADVQLNATPSYTDPITTTTWTATRNGVDVTGDVVWTPGGTWQTMLAKLPPSLFNIGDVVIVTVSDTTNHVAAQTSVIVAPADTEDEQVVIGYGATGELYITRTAGWNISSGGTVTVPEHWALPVTNVPYPIQHVLQHGVYAANVTLGGTHQIGSIACYVLNLKTFNGVFGL